MGKRDMKRAIKVLKSRRDDMMRAIDSIDHLLECSLNNYNFMIDFAIKKGFKRVIDIGCAYGYQSELCEGKIDYVGVDEDLVNFYNQERYDYYVGKYPQKISFLMDESEIAISNLAIGWNCYVNEKEFEKQCKALVEDFKACLLYLPTDREKILNKYFNHVEIYKKEESKFVPTAFYYCYN